jgi:hypothetical protein
MKYQKLSRYALGGLVGVCMFGGAAEAATHGTITALARNVYQNLYGIAVDSHGVYVTGATGILRDFDGQNDDGVVGIIPLAGGSVTTLYGKGNYPTQSGHITPLQIATDGRGNLVWSDPEVQGSTGSGMVAGSFAGGAASLIFTSCCGAGAFPGDAVGAAINKGIISFTDSTTGAVGVVSGGAPVQVSVERYGPDFGQEAFSQMAVAAGVTYLADSALEPENDNGVQAFIDRSSQYPAGVTKVVASGAGQVFTTLTTAIPHPRGVVAVGPFLYVTSANAIWVVNRTNGKTHLYLRSVLFKDLQGIAYYKGAFYVADSQNSYAQETSGGVIDATKDLPGLVWKVTP